MSKIQMDEGAKVSQHNIGLDTNDQCHSPHIAQGLPKWLSPRFETNTMCIKNVSLKQQTADDAADYLK